MVSRPLVALVHIDPRALHRAVSEVWGEGAAVLPLDPRLPEDQVRRILELCRPERLVTEEGVSALQRPRPVGGNAACVLLTSGSSGRPKPVELSEEALSTAAELVHERIGATSGQRWLCCVPLFHVAGFAMLFRARHLGSDLEVHDGFDVEAVGASDADLVSLVPTQLKRLIDAGVDLSRFSTILLGGAAIPEDLLRSAVSAGARIVRTYGMTETCGGVVYDGMPLRGVTVAALGGRLRISTPTMMTGYVGLPDLTSERLRDGWLTTDDAGVVEDGIVRVQGRVDGIIVSGGEKIAPEEVRRALLGHPDVRDAAVVGIPDLEWGQKVGALVAGEVAADQVISWLRERVARHKVPKIVTVVPEIPRNDMGKVDLERVRSLLSS